MAPTVHWVPLGLLNNSESSSVNFGRGRGDLSSTRRLRSQWIRLQDPEYGNLMSLCRLHGPLMLGPNQSWLAPLSIKQFLLLRFSQKLDLPPTCFCIGMIIYYNNCVYNYLKNTAIVLNEICFRVLFCFVLKKEMEFFDKLWKRIKKKTVSFLILLI